MTSTPIETVDQVETLRTIRNACRATLHDRREISAAQQLAWWTALDRSRWEGKLFSDDCGLVGAGCWSLRNEVWWITVLVLPHRRGEGRGTAIYRALQTEPPALDVFALIRASNVPSLRAARRAGWRHIEGELWRYPA